MRASYPVSVALAEAINHLNELLKKESDSDFSYSILVCGNKVAASNLNDGLITPLSKAATPKQLGATISYEVVETPLGREAYKHIRITIPETKDETEDEYELNFPLDSKDEDILNTPLHYWRII